MYDNEVSSEEELTEMVNMMINFDYINNEDTNRGGSHQDSPIFLSSTEFHWFPSRALFISEQLYQIPLSSARLRPVPSSSTEVHSTPPYSTDLRRAPFGVSELRWAQPCSVEILRHLKSSALLWQAPPISIKHICWDPPSSAELFSTPQRFTDPCIAPFSFTALRGALPSSNNLGRTLPSS